MRRTVFACCLLLTTTLSAACRADYWTGPQPGMFASEQGDRVLKVLPNRAEGPRCTSSATWIYLNPDGSERILNQLKLVNAPVRVLIPDSTVSYFVTLDTQTSMGYDHAIVIYRSKGQVVRDLKLEDFLTRKEIHDHVERSTGSRWWRKGVNFNFEIPSTTIIEEKGDHKIAHVETEPKNTNLRISFPWGKQVVIKLATGEVLPKDG